MDDYFLKDVVHQRLMADLHTTNKRLSDLINDPYPEIETWYMALHITVREIGILQHRIEGRRKNLFC